MCGSSETNVSGPHHRKYDVVVFAQIEDSDQHWLPVSPVRVFTVLMKKDFFNECTSMTLTRLGRCLFYTNTPAV